MLVVRREGTVGEWVVEGSRRGLGNEAFFSIYVLSLCKGLAIK